MFIPTPTHYIVLINITSDKIPYEIMNKTNKQNKKNIKIFEDIRYKINEAYILYFFIFIS